MTDIPIAATIVTLASLALPIAIPAVLYRGTLAAGESRRSARILFAGSALALFGWLAITYVLARSGQYAVEPWQAIGVTAPLLGGLIALRLPVVRRALDYPHAIADLAALQVVRLVGVAFLVALAVGSLPPSFALPAGIGDILVGLAALTVARRLRGAPRRRGLATTFNVLGILDLVVAISLGLLHAPGRFQTIITDPTAEIMGLLPIALIPTYVVPLTLLLHIASLVLIAANQRTPMRGTIAVG